MQDVLMFLVLSWPTHPFWIWCFVRWYWSFKDPSSQTAASCSSTASNVRRRTSFYLCTHCSSCAWLRGRRYCLWELWTDAIDSNCFSNSLAFLPASSILNCRSSPGERRIHRTVLYTFSGCFFFNLVLCGNMKVYSHLIQSTTLGYIQCNYWVFSWCWTDEHEHKC